VGKSKPKTKVQLDRAADSRLKKTYNISLTDYENLLAMNDGKCWICDRPPGERRLHVDHDHSYKKVKIATFQLSSRPGTWTATGEYNGVDYLANAPKRSLAVRDLKRQLLRASIRGLLCYNHNSGLQKFSDKSEWLGSAAAYLAKFVTKGGPLTGQENV
jgi:hypothetical protein